ALGGSKERRSGARVDSSCLPMTLKSGLDKRRSNSLNTRGCGESRQMDSFAGLERLVATAVRVVKTGRTGKGLWGRCSRIVTDEWGVFHRTGSGSALPGSREKQLPHLARKVAVRRRRPAY